MTAQNEQSKQLQVNKFDIIAQTSDERGHRYRKKRKRFVLLCLENCPDIYTNPVKYLILSRPNYGSDNFPVGAVRKTKLNPDKTYKIIFNLK